MIPTETASAQPGPSAARLQISRRSAAFAGAGIGVAALAAALVYGGGGTAETSQKAGAPQAAALADQVARQLNAEGPVSVDAKTTRLGVSAEGSRLVYRMGLSEDIPAARVDSTRARLAASNAEVLCTGQDTRQLIALGGTFQHIYIDSTGDTFGTLVSRCSGASASPPLPRAM